MFIILGSLTIPLFVQMYLELEHTNQRAKTDTPVPVQEMDKALTAHITQHHQPMSEADVLSKKAP